jgi:hypothetical protein
MFEKIKKKKLQMGKKEVFQFCSLRGVTLDDGPNLQEGAGVTQLPKLYA